MTMTVVDRLEHLRVLGKGKPGAANVATEDALCVLVVAASNGLQQQTVFEVRD